MLPMDGGYVKVEVVRCKTDAYENPVGYSNRNPLIKSRFYTANFGHGTLHEYTSNFISNNMYAHVYDKGREHIFMRSIVEHQGCDNVVKK